MKKIVVAILVAMAIMMTGCAVKFQIQRDDMYKMDKSSSMLFAYTSMLFAYNWTARGIYYA